MTLKKKVRDMVSFRLAGMSDEAGGLSSHFQARQYAVPEDIKLSGDMLVWRVREVFLHDEISNALLRKKPSDPELLVRFTKLADAPPAEILKFARKWGVLGICKHLLPYTHNPPPLFRGEKRFWCTPMRNEDREFWEPIDAWHVYSRQMQSMLRIAANLHQDRPGELNDWNILYDLGPAGNGCGQGLYLIDDRHMLAVLVNFWIKVGNVRPTFSWSGDTTFVSFDTHLFGALVGQLLTFVSRTKGLGVCSGCGDTFIPVRRRPKADQRNYCVKCGRKAAWRDAQRDRRRRLKTEA